MTDTAREMGDTKAVQWGARLGYVSKDARTTRYALGTRLYRLAHRETYLRSLVRLAQHIGIRTRNEFSQQQLHGHGGAHPALGVGLMEQQQLQQHTTTAATNRLIRRTA